MKEKELLEKIKNVLIQDLGYSSKHIFRRSSRLYLFDLEIQVDKRILFFIKVNSEEVKKQRELISSLKNSVRNVGVEYFALVNSNLEWTVYKNQLNGLTELKGKRDLHISQMLKLSEKITDIHNDCFNYLYKEKHINEDRNFTFHLRTDNRRKRLEKGYFFLGNENYCAISFWTGNDWKNKTPNIYLEINKDEDVRLVLSAKDSEKKEAFIKQVVRHLGAVPNKLKGETNAVWIKNYNTGSYLEILKEFVRVDKEIIDAQIFKEKIKATNNLDGIDFIPIDVFKENLNRVLVYRNKLAHEPIKDFEEQKSTVPIKIHSVALQRIAMFESFSMDLSNRIICIIGDNGTGKSTLLRTIVLGLIGVGESTEIDPEETKYSELQKLLQMKGLDKNGNISYLGNGKVTVEYSMDKKYTNAVLLQKQKNSLDIVLSDDFASDGFVALSDSNYFPNLVIGFTQGGRAQSYKFGTYEKQRGNVGDVCALLFNAKQEHFEELEQWIFELDGDSATDKRAKQVLNFVFEVVTGVIGMKITLHKVEHQRKEVWVKIADGELVLFNLISQGFTKVFAWIGYFIKRLSECNSEMENFKDAPAILLIDEIDTYLHPKWQRNILAFLAETFTNTQFIVTTHSPLVANYLNPAKIKGGVALYRLEKGTTEPKKFEKIYGRDLSAVFFDWMGVPNRNPEIDKEIDEILHLISKETPESLKAAKEKIAKIQMEEYDEIMAEIKSSLEYAEEHLGG